MPEWTGNQRKEFYACLAEGRLPAVLDFARRFPGLMQNDLRPIDKKAMEKFATMLAVNEENQWLLARSVLDARQTVRRIALFLLSQVDAFPGTIFETLLNEILKEINENLWNVRKNHERWLVNQDEDAEERNKIEDCMTELLLSAFSDAAWDSIKRLRLLFEGIAACPSGEALAAWDEACPQLHSSVSTDSTIKRSVKRAIDRLRKTNKADAGEKDSVEEPARPADRAGLLQACRKMIKKHFGGKYIDGEFYQAINQKLEPAFRELLKPLLADLDEDLLSLIMAEDQMSSGWFCLEMADVLVDLFGLEEARRRLLRIAGEVRSRQGDDKPKPKYGTVPYFALDLIDHLDAAVAARDPLTDLVSLKAWRCVIHCNQRYDRLIKDTDDFAAEVASMMQSDDPRFVDLYFRIAFLRPDLLARLNEDLVRLTAFGLWLRDAGEAVLAVRRLHALAAFGRCTPAAAAAAIEQAFTIEEPTLWRAAADALKALRKKDPNLALQNPARVRELLARDPEKYGKYLNPLLKNTPEASRHA